MYYKHFRVVLSIFQPKKDIALDFTTDKLKKQIRDAKDKYNEKHAGLKVIEDIELTKGTITLYLKIGIPNPETKIELYRTVTFFSRYLYRDCGWSAYSGIETRLFTIIESKEINVDEKDSAIISTLIQNNTIATEDDLFLKKERLRWLYATKAFIEAEIKVLEDGGIRI